jgi:hypothetical protein
MKKTQEVLLYLLVLGAPLGAYQYLPYFNVTLSEMALGLLLPLVIVSLPQNKPLLPFELWWPAALIMALALCLPAVPSSVALWPIAFILVFLALRTRESLETCLLLAAIGGGLGAILSISAQLGWVYSTDATVLGLPAAGLYGDARAEAVQFLGLAPLAAILSMKRASALSARIVVGVSAALMLVALALVLFRQLQAEPARIAQSILRLDAGSIAMLALLFWCCSRILAKLLLLQQQERDPLAAPLFVASAAAMAGAVVLLPAPQLSFALLLAMAARACAPFRETRQAPHLALWITPAALLLAINLCIIPLANTRDPRNYEALGERLLSSSHIEKLDQRLNALARHIPEARVRLWQARTALLRGEQEMAADAFTDAAQQPVRLRPSRLPAPDAKDYTALLDRFRDMVSGLPEQQRGISYERALVAAGETSSALASLRFRATDPAQPVDPERAAREIAACLGDRAIAETLLTWPESDLAAIYALTDNCGEGD